MVWGDHWGPGDACHAVLGSILPPSSVPSFRIQGGGFKVNRQNLHPYTLRGLGFRVQGAEYRLRGSWFGVQGLGFRVFCSGLRSLVLGFNVRDSVFKA